MDLISELLRHPDISAYLHSYPQTQWLAVIQSTMLYGISSLRALRAAGLSADVMEDASHQPLVPGLKGKLQDMKTQLEEIDKFLEDAPKREDAQRSSSVPGRTRAEKRAQPKQTKGEDYGQLIYPDWWPQDSAPRPPVPKRAPRPKTAKPATAAAKVSTFRDPKDQKPIMKTTGTSTAAAKPPFRFNYTPRPGPKQMKTVGFSQERVEQQAEERPRSDLIEPSEEESSGLPPAGSSLSSSKEPRLKWSLPEDDLQPLEERKTPAQRGDSRTVKRQQFANWVGDFSNVVKRSPLQSSAEFTSQSSDHRLKESSSASRREPLADGSRRFETSSASSISTYHPTEELKAFYRNEHEKIFAERKGGLKTLETREMPLDPGHVSMSAQLYRTSGSSDISEGDRGEVLGSTDSFSRS